MDTTWLRPSSVLPEPSATESAPIVSAPSPNALLRAPLACALSPSTKWCSPEAFESASLPDKRLLFSGFVCVFLPLVLPALSLKASVFNGESFACVCAFMELRFVNRSASKHIDGALELPDVNGVCKHRTVCQISELTQRGFASNRYAMRAVRHRVSAQRNGIGMRLSREP